jgi:putative chromate ion transporter
MYVRVDSIEIFCSRKFDLTSNFRPATVQTILIKSAWTLPLSLAIFGILSYIWLTKYRPEEAPPPPPIDESHDPAPDSDNPLDTVKSLWTPETKIGAAMIAASAVTLVLLIILRALSPDCILCGVAETFYRVGALIYGGGQVVLPMMITELVDSGIMTEATFLYGLTIIQILPGPLFNFAAFLGAVIHGLWGALVAWILIFAPGVLLIFGVYPFWHRLAKMSWMQKVLVGVNAAALGFILSAFFLLFAKVPTIYDACAVLVCCLVAFYDLNTPAAIGVGGATGILIGLIFDSSHIVPPSAPSPMAPFGIPVSSFNFTPIVEPPIDLSS